MSQERIRKTTNAETAKERLTKARALLDATEYVALMRRVSPQSLSEFAPNGEIVLNTIEGEVIFRDAKTFLNSTSEEMVVYARHLAAAVKNIISEKKR